MSSFLAHSIVGYSIAQQEKSLTIQTHIFTSLFFIVLASSPDIDYAINYLRGESFSIRYTHSIGYIFLIGIFAVILKYLFFRNILEYSSNIFLFIAPLSHLILDGLVGVHGNPYLYPFSETLFTFPYGILPSSGRIDFGNYYFWRNLLIELGLFIPFLFAITPAFRAYIKNKKYFIWLLLIIFIIALLIGLNLDR